MYDHQVAPWIRLQDLEGTQCVGKQDVVNGAGYIPRLPELVSHRKACEMVDDLVRSGADAVGWGMGAMGAEIDGFLYSATVGTVSCALYLIRIVSS